MSTLHQEITREIEGFIETHGWEYDYAREMVLGSYYEDVQSEFEKYDVTAIPGIYVIESRLTSLVYVGQSADAPVRWMYHLRDLSSGTHHNAALRCGGPLG